MLLKAVYDKLVEKSKNIDTFDLKTNSDTDKTDLKNKIPDTSGLVNAKISEIESYE